MSKSIVWFRNDLRIKDNAALYHACQENIVIGVYIEATKQRVLHHDSDSKVGFIYDSLLALRNELSNLNIPLLIFKVDYYSDIPSKLIQTAQEHQASSIWFNNEYLLNEIERDKAVEQAADSSQIQPHRFDCDMILPPNIVRKPNGSEYKVFTPFKKAWIKQHKIYKENSYPAPTKQDFKLNSNQNTTEAFGKPYREDLWPAGSKSAEQKLKLFLPKAQDYTNHRDIPSKAGTSFLSPYLAVGAISAKQCIEQLYDSYLGDESSFYADTWLSELIWREFYRQVIIDNPKVVIHKPYKAHANEPWENSYDLFEAWKQGNTGFPIIDAAMRQLNQTGWMHNRLRMNAAMFLCKLCRVDWRWGEKYFMQQLIDGDFASNNGGWQWCSSTGADGAPYFRIMNPTTQSKRFDKDGFFIKKFVPELSTLDAKSIHEPNADQRKLCGYPEPIINYKSSRQRTIELMA